ncbi:MAG: RNA polymerase subunit sigma, partial [Acidobacteria bacterium]|nr:RNA polymerase subunit sigma [Acidobacteriota bacterium]
ARLDTRSDSAGELLLLSEQDRRRWDPRRLRLGFHYLVRAARGDRVTTYHLEAEIAACHAQAPSFETTDWQRILDSYDELLLLNPSPVIALNRAVALGQIRGPAAALEEIAGLRDHPALADYYPLHATLGELYHQTGREAEALLHYRRALELTACEPVRRFLRRRLAR